MILTGFKKEELLNSDVCLFCGCMLHDVFANCEPIFMMIEDDFLIQDQVKFLIFCFSSLKLLFHLDVKCENVTSIM